MQFSQDINPAAYVIRSYGPGEVVLSEPLSSTPATSGPNPDERGKSFQKKTLTRSAILSFDKLLDHWPPQHVGELTPSHLTQVLALAPEIVLLGTGKKLEWPPAAVLRPLIDNNIGIEVMDTPAACRTYNILMLEGRRVALALMMI
jgi:uncharacterized protein